MKKVLLGLSLAVAMFAANSEYKYEITPMIGGVMPEGNLDLGNQLDAGLRFGYNLHDYWADQVELGLDYSPSVNVDHTDGKDVNIFRGSVNLLKDIYATNGVTFYGIVGAGVEILSNQLRGNNNRPFVNYGAGLKYHFTDQLALRAEVKHAVKLNGHNNLNPSYANNNLFYSVGLSYAFGETGHAAAPVVEKVEKVEKAEVAEKITMGYDDNDGVSNNVDECPNTPAGVPVDEKGCAKTMSLHVKFDFDKAKVKPQYKNEINQVANFMNKYSTYKVALEGYTDNTGPEKYNLKLSDKRSNAVAKELIKLGVESTRITTSGYGEANPVTTNKTRAGRAQNRRVDAVFSH